MTKELLVGQITAEFRFYINKDNQCKTQVHLINESVESTLQWAEESGNNKFKLTLVYE